MKYKDIIGYSKPKKVVKKQPKPKTNKVLEGIKKDLNEWNDETFKTLPKRWSGAYGAKSGLTEYERKKLKEAGFESKDGKAAQRQYKKIYEKGIRNGEQYYASSVDQLADFMEQQGLGNQAQMLRGEYMRVVQKWQDKWLKQFVKSLK